MMQTGALKIKNHGSTRTSTRWRSWLICTIVGSFIPALGTQGLSQTRSLPSLPANRQNPSPNRFIKQPSTGVSRSSSVTQLIFQPKIKVSEDERQNTGLSTSHAIVRLTTTQREAAANSQQTDELLPPPTSPQSSTKETPQSSASPTPYDEVFLLPPPPAKTKQTPTPEFVQPRLKAETDQDSLLPEPIVGNDAPSPSDRPVPPNKPLETNGDDDLLEERGVTPYKNPSIEGPAEKVVPLPIIPAPPDFKGFGPRDPDLDSQLPEPRRTFPLPKVPQPEPPELLTPEMRPGFVPNGVGTLPGDIGAMPLQGAFQSPEFGSLLAPPSSQRGLGTLRADGVVNNAMRPANYQPIQANPYNPNPIAENRPTLAPISTLPERLHNRYWQYEVGKDLPYSSNSHPALGNCLQEVPYQASDFAPIPQAPQPLNPCREIETYFGKSLVETQRPWVEWWRPFYTGGMYDPGIPVFSDANLLTPSFLVYGDYRTGVGIHRANGENIRNWAHRLNLDMDLRLTGTERFHMFTGPLDHNGRFTRLDFSDSPVEFEEELDFQMETAFFEGDLGAITGGFKGIDAPFDLPFTCGLVPLLYQNGIWMEDAILGFAVGSPWRNSKELNWSNYEATFFAGFNQVTSPAFQNDNSAAAVFGTAWFVEAYNGYIEMDYAYIDDLDNLGRSYHNAAIAYTRRYFGRISNTVRLIGNAGQSGPLANRSADGGLLLFENSLITSQPSTLVPYWNLFLGNGRPQSVARAGNSGGILRNTGINFEGDGLTDYPTLAATGANSYGGAVGVNLLGADFGSQFIVEFAAIDNYGDPVISGIAGPQYALGSRYQRAINNRSLWRVDFINGWLDDAPNIYGTRAEFRWKF